jgi:hypothetical protein
MGEAFWPGVRGFVSCSYTVSHDVGAGIAALEIPEQDLRSVATYGDLVITDGVGTVVLRRCKLADVQYSAGGGPRTITLLIADRRWQWRFGRVQGDWNQQEPYPDPDDFPEGEFVVSGGPYAPGTYRTAADLMGDCLEALGEREPVVLDPPSVPVPARWGSGESPAPALSQVAAAVGYRVVYQPCADRVLVAPQGDGAALPANLPIASDSGSVNLPQRPGAIAVVGGPTLYQDFLALEPVGFEKSGACRPINKLSFAPGMRANGVGNWQHSNPLSFWEAEATDELTHEEAMALAKRHVWRTFRVRQIDVAQFADDVFDQILLNNANFGAPGQVPPISVGGFGAVPDRRQIVLNQVTYSGNRGISGGYESEPAWCVGYVYVGIGAAGQALGNKVDATGHTLFPGQGGGRLPWLPQVDGERGLVGFERQMYAMTVNGDTKSFLEPALLVYTSFAIRSLVGRVPVCFEYGGQVGGLAGAVAALGCPPEYVARPELQLHVRTVRKDKLEFPIASVADNSDEVLPAAQYHLGAALAKYEIGAAADRTYAGIWPLDPDGAIQSVTWRVGGGVPATTRASRNTEHAQYLPSFPERRRNVQVHRMIDGTEKQVAEDSAPKPGRTPPPPGAEI